MVVHAKLAEYAREREEQQTDGVLRGFVPVTLDRNVH